MRIEYFLGLIGCALAVILAGSPLATLANVIKEKTTKSLSFNFTFATWMNAISWLLYGVLVANDPMIYGPNAFGLFLASIQLLLFAVYGFPNDSRGNYKVVAQADEVEIKPIF